MAYLFVSVAVAGGLLALLAVWLALQRRERMAYRVLGQISQALADSAKGSRVSN